jgi:hypothetical protein
MPTGETHATAVIVVQDVVEQSVPPARAVAVTAGTPKSNPSSVITAAPEVGLFGIDTLLVTGALYVNACVVVPTSAATVSVAVFLPPTPPAKAVVQRSELSLVHEAVSQDVLPNCAVTVLSLGPNCKPVRVMLEPPVVPALAGARPQINGLLYVK